jgi:hypothetical protein
LLYCCFTAAILLLCLFNKAHDASSSEFGGALAAVAALLLYGCFTSALLLLFLTAASWKVRRPLLYCFTAALVHSFTAALLHCCTAALLHCCTAPLLLLYCVTLLYCFTAALLQL